MAQEKVYWKSVEQLAGHEAATRLANNEFAEEIPTTEFLGDDNVMQSTTSRRDFLKYLGFTTAAATLAACEQPVIESVPYVVKPDTLTPGVPSYYATTYVDGQDFANILVKTREGRPIKVEPGDAGLLNSGTNARAQASVLSLYDSTRLRGPEAAGSDSSWEEIASALQSSVENSVAEGKQFVLVTGSVFSPSYKRVISALRQQYANFNHVEIDAVSSSEVLDVWEALTGERALPMYDLSKASLIVSVGDDFLSGNGAQQMNSAYAERRKPGQDMLRHIQIESNMSLTGSNADKRIKIKPSQQGAVLNYLYNKVSDMGDARQGQLPEVLREQLSQVAKELRAAGSGAVVFAGGNSGANAHMAAALNAASDVVSGSHNMRRGDDKAFDNLVKSLNQGQVGTLVVAGANPAYSRVGFGDAMTKAKFSLALCDRLDETASIADAAAPGPHYLEAWGDYMPVRGELSVAQPTIRPLFDSKPAVEVLGALVGMTESSQDMVKATLSSYGLSWNQTMHDGGAKVDQSTETANSWRAAAVAGVPAASDAALSTKGSDFELALYENVLGHGHQSNNPWLHELPDSITRTSWDNYITISAADALDLGVINDTEMSGAMNGSMVNITANGVTLEGVPALVQPGQAQGTIGLAYGYGRTSAGPVADGLGFNAQALGLTSGHGAVTITLAEGEHGFACVQLGNTMMGRKIVNEVTLADYMNDPSGESWNDKPVFHTIDSHLTSKEANLWKEHDHESMHMWNMSIDLNNCLGCGSCVVACHIENNVPVVGKEEIRNFRDMHWLRIDRYYSSDMNKEVASEEGLSGVGGAIEMYSRMEEPSASPDVVYQPVMCQHCNHAPCETVCPVAATSHGREGLNHMAYNRCIGTRYCANNCPYKVRRFNWFNYIANEKFADVNPAQDDLGRMVLNPDVTVRSRGVMEKCSMCIQRIQHGKLEAKKNGEPLKDGQFTTACAQACETGAIVFGDVNDKHSEVHEAKQDARAYHLLEEIGTQPSIFYQTKVRNRA